MRIAYLPVCLAFAVSAPQAVSGQDPKYSEIVSELDQGKQKAIDLVKEFKASQPGRNDQLLMMQRYDDAKEKYKTWAEEAAGVVIKNPKKIEYDSQKAKDAKSSLAALKQFTADYAKRSKEEETQKLGVASQKRDWKKLVQIAKEVQKNWTYVDKAAKWWREHREKELQKREAFAAEILKSADWPNFEAI